MEHPNSSPDGNSPFNFPRTSLDPAQDILGSHLSPSEHHQSMQTLQDPLNHSMYWSLDSQLGPFDATQYHEHNYNSFGLSSNWPMPPHFQPGNGPQRVQQPMCGSGTVFPGPSNFLETQQHGAILPSGQELPPTPVTMRGSTSTGSGSQRQNRSPDQMKAYHKHAVPVIDKCRELLREAAVKSGYPFNELVEILFGFLKEDFNDSISSTSLINAADKEPKRKVPTQLCPGVIHLDIDENTCAEGHELRHVILFVQRLMQNECSTKVIRSKITPYIPCPKCDKLLPDATTLVRHLQHTGPGLVTLCPIEGCDAVFHRKDRLPKHLREDHNELDLTNEAAVQRANSAQQVIIRFRGVCPICETQFESFHELYNKHYPSHFIRLVENNQQATGSESHNQEPDGRSSGDQNGSSGDFNQPYGGSSHQGNAGGSSASRSRDPTYHASQYHGSSYRDCLILHEARMEAHPGGSIAASSRVTSVSSSSSGASEVHPDSEISLEDYLYKMALRSCPVQAVEPGGRLRCPLGCGFVTNNQSAWLSHVSGHSPANVWRCGECQRFLNSTTEVSLHELEYPHHVYSNEGAKLLQYVYSGNKRHECGFCEWQSHDWTEFWAKHVMDHVRKGDAISQRWMPNYWAQAFDDPVSDDSSCTQSGLGRTSEVYAPSTRSATQEPHIHFDQAVMTRPKSIKHESPDVSPLSDPASDDRQTSNDLSLAEALGIEPTSEVDMQDILKEGPGPSEPALTSDQTVLMKAPADSSPLRAFAAAASRCNTDASSVSQRSGSPVPSMLSSATSRDTQSTFSGKRQGLADRIRRFSIASDHDSGFYEESTYSQSRRKVLRLSPQSDTLNQQTQLDNRMLRDIHACWNVGKLDNNQLCQRLLIIYAKEACVSQNTSSSMCNTSSSIKAEHNQKLSNLCAEFRVNPPDVKYYDNFLQMHNQARARWCGFCQQTYQKTFEAMIRHVTQDCQSPNRQAEQWAPRPIELNHSRSCVVCEHNGEEKWSRRLWTTFQRERNNNR